jgi:23S rRNA pseudouridine2457 synthase
VVAFKYLILNKPYGVVTQFGDQAEVGHRTLGELVPVPGVYAVGRLDKDSEGLLLLTDDGELQHRLSHPKFEHEKTYWAQVEGVPDDAALARLRKGVRIQDYLTRPATARRIDPPAISPRVPPIRVRRAIPDSWIEIKLTEGRNRQVRRMLAAVGFPVLRLIRLAIGELRIDGLAPGQWRFLRDAEFHQVQRISAAQKTKKRTLT